MDGKLTQEKLDVFVSDLFAYSRYAVEKTGFPYVSFVLRNGVLLSRDMNTTMIDLDPALQCSVTAIRKVQSSLETNDLAGCTLLSLFEPTILSFDVALWAGINKFIWCINTKSAPEHYHTFSYSPLIYAQNHPKEIHIQPEYREKEALSIVEKLKQLNSYIKA